MNNLKCLVIFLMAVFAIESAIFSQNQTTPFVKVYGKGKASVVPDEIFVGYTLYAQDKVVTEARRKNKELAIKSITYLKSINIPERHIQTKYMSIHPVKEHNRSEIISHYRATQTITICLEDIETFEKVIDELLGMGITQINSPIFKSTKQKEKLVEAQQLALINARNEAERMASTLKMRVGEPIEIIDIDVAQNNFNPNAYETSSASNNSDGTSGIALGELIMNAQVEVKFELIGKKLRD